MSNKDIVTNGYSLLFGDCLERMKEIPDGSVDLILTDPPYGTTACKWDSVIDFALMWVELNRVIKPNGAIVLFGSEPFSSALRMSNIKQYKYDWVWVKNVSTNFLHAKRQPLRNTENIHVFYKKCGKYYPIKSTGHTPTQSAKGCSNGVLYHGENTRNYSGGETTRYPKTTIEFDVVDLKNRLHPTQKPVALLEYLIKTYTQENEIVLDFTFGGCSTGVAALNTNRRFIGVEMEEKYFDIGVKRMQESIIKGGKLNV